MKLVIFLLSLIIYSPVFAQEATISVTRKLEFHVAVSIEEHIPDSMVLSIKPTGFGGLLSLDLINAYDNFGRHRGFILLIFKESLCDYDINNSGVLDIEDLTDMVDYMFGEKK